MKYVFIIMFLLTMTGCSNKKLELDNINLIKYNDTVFINEDYNIIKNDLLKLSFKCHKNKSVEGKNLQIITNNNLYNIYISNNYYMEFFDNNMYCSTNNKKVENILNNLEDLEKKYNNKFYSITNIQNYNANENDEIIKIDKSDNYLIININDEIYNFTINEIETDNNKYSEINLIYFNEKIDKRNIVIRNNNFSNIKITFSNKYNYVVEIIPYYENEVLKFKEKIYQKK